MDILKPVDVKLTNLKLLEADFQISSVKSDFYAFSDFHDCSFISYFKSKWDMNNKNDTRAGRND